MSSASGDAPRVLYVMSGLAPTVGGPASSAPNIWISAARADVRVTVAVPVPSTPSSRERAIIGALRAEGVDFYAFPVSGLVPVFRHWGVSPALLLWVLRSAGKFDIIQGHGAWVLSSLVALFTAKLHRKVFVLLPHESLAESDVRKGRNPLRHWIKAIIKSLYMRFADYYVLASRIERSHSIDVGARGGYVCLYHPLVDDAFALEPRRSWPAKLEKLRVGFLGRFDPKKNLEVVLRAVAALPNVSLDIAGTGPDIYERALHDLAADCGLGNRIRWLGFISADQRREFFSSIDVLAMPSAFECFGMAAAEAMQHGVPVVVSEPTGVAELVTQFECGRVVATTAMALHDALFDFQENPGMLELFSTRGIETCATELSFSRYGSRLAAVYRNLTQRVSI